MFTFRPSVPQRPMFITIDAGRQFIGSFHPISTDFFADAYAPPSAQGNLTTKTGRLDLRRGASVSTFGRMDTLPRANWGHWGAGWHHEAFDRKFPHVKQGYYRRVFGSSKGYGADTANWLEEQD